jgi:hypothetical protein
MEAALQTGDSFLNDRIEGCVKLGLKRATLACGETGHLFYYLRPLLRLLELDFQLIVFFRQCGFQSDKLLSAKSAFFAGATAQGARARGSKGRLRELPSRKGA